MNFHGVDVERLDQLLATCTSLVDALERAESVAVSLAAELGDAWVGTDSNDLQQHWRQVDAIALAEVTRLVEGATGRLQRRADDAAPAAEPVLDSTSGGKGLEINLDAFAARQSEHRAIDDRLETFAALQNAPSFALSKSVRSGDKVPVLA